MPIYEYECDACQNRFEVQQSMRDEPITQCPHCAGHVRRVFTPNTIIFKGSGFYSTDNAPKKAPETPPCGKSGAPCPSCSTS